jgi:hypothetical protein
MKEYKLIKEYPGSPELGIICEERNNKSSFCYYYEGEKNVGILKNEVENQPEYWEEVVENIYYMVSLIDMGFHNAWEPIRVETIKYDTDTKKYFSTKEGARDFIIQHKPCLSFNEVRGLVGHSFFGSTSHQRLFELAKSRI